jgi:hypothetical protein
MWGELYVSDAAGRESLYFCELGARKLAKIDQGNAEQTGLEEATMNLLGKLLIVASLPLTLTALHKDSGANTIEVWIRGNRVAKLFSCTGLTRTTGDRSTAHCLA